MHSYFDACRPRGPCTSVRATHVYVDNKKCIYRTWLLQRVCVREFTTEESRYIGDMAVRRSFFFFFLKFYLVLEVMVGWMGSIGPGMLHFNRSLT